MERLQRKLADYTASLYDECIELSLFFGGCEKKILDEQFIQLQQLQDESNPDFVVEVVSIFFEDSERLLNELAKALNQTNVDFKKMDTYVHQLKGSSSSIGAQRVLRWCIAFRNYCDEHNVEGCLKCLQQIRNEYIVVKNKLETLFKLEKQFADAGGSFPVVGI